MSTARSGGGHGGGGGKGDKPPILANHSNAPQYDLATIVQLIGVRPMVLWGWEQQLGIPAPTRVYDQVSGVVRRYSERDLVAALWLRDQILNGATPTEAGFRLLSAQDDSGDDEAWSGGDATPWNGGGGSSIEPVRSRVFTGPLSESNFGPQRSQKKTRPLADGEYLSLTPDGMLEQGSSLGGQPGSSRGRPSGPLGTAAYGLPVSPETSASARGPEAGASYSGQQALPPLRSGPSGPIVGGRISGPLSGSVWGGSDPSGSLASALSSYPQQATPTGSLENRGAGVPWIGPGTTITRGRELRALQPQLIHAFANLDTFGANHVVNEALASRSIETVCIGLLQPTLSRIGEQWARHEITLTEERFALSYVRSLLYSFFHKTPERTEAPLVIVTCGPRELSDLGALILAVFWRRAGLRVVFLGQDADSDSLVEEARKQRPTLLAISVTTTQRIRSLARLAKQVSQLDTPRPIFTFAGPVFARNPELQRKVGGVYLGDDAATATWHVTRLLGIDRNPPAAI